jgi:uncharacterized membrane protein YhhN
MAVSIVLGMAVILLVGLILAEKTNVPWRILIFKAPLSFLFIVAWHLQPPLDDFFSNLILVALGLCFVGDILLAFGSRKIFLLGLISFLLGHVVYATAFFMAGKMGPLMAPGAILLVASAVLIWRWLEPYLGTMQGPVLAYMVVISIMVCGAFGVAGNPAMPVRARVGVLAGAVLFYLSDICVARQRFVARTLFDRAVGLPIYYAAQFLLAFSAAWVAV